VSGFLASILAKAALLLLEALVARIVQAIVFPNLRGRPGTA
jgi:hypothetical protein